MVGRLRIVIEIFRTTLTFGRWVRELPHAAITVLRPFIVINVAPLPILAVGALHSKSAAAHRYRAHFLEADTHLSTTTRGITIHKFHLDPLEIDEDHSCPSRKGYAILLVPKGFPWS